MTTEQAFELPPLPKARAWITPSTGAIWDSFSHSRDTVHSGADLTAFAQLAVNEALERAAKVCEEIVIQHSLKDDSRSSGKKAGAFECYEAIRAMKGPK